MNIFKKLSFIGVVTTFLVALFVSVMSNPVSASAASTVTRSFSSATPTVSSTLTVTLAVNVVSPDTYYAIDETIPTGWVITDPGTGDTSQANHIKWVVITGATSTSYQYTVLVSADASGTNNFSGQFGTDSINPPIAIFGPDSVAISSTQALDIVSVTNPEDIDVVVDTALNTINFPDFVDVTLDDNSTTSLPVVWDFNSDPAYDGSATGTYAFTGTLTISDPEYITNTQNLTAIENVDVEDTYIPTLTLTTIAVSPMSSILTVGNSQQFSAVGYDQNSTVLTTQPTFTWASSNATVGTVDSTGLFSALTAGTSTVTATSGTTTGSTLVTVQTQTSTSTASTTALTVTQIMPVKTSAVSDNTYANGWNWTFNVTVPDNETSLGMKFSDWTSGSNILPAAGNIRYFSAQSSNANSEASAISIGSANTYPVTNMILSGDLDAVSTGRQIQVTVQVKIPAGTANGSYSTTYGIQSNVPVVITQPLNITSVNNPVNMTVNLGTLLNTITFPDNVGVVLSDSSTTSLPVVWNFTSTPVYDENATGTYAFSGALTLPTNITNTSNLMTTENVIVQASTTSTTTPQVLNVISVTNPEDIDVVVDTALNTINFPDFVDVTLDDNSTTSLPVVWDFNSDPAYDGSATGTYAFTGTLTISDPEYITNTQNLTAIENVDVEDTSTQPLDAISVASLPDINVTTDTALGDINFPDNVDVTLSDDSVISIPVIWNGTSDPVYDEDEDGTYVFSASLVLPNDVTNTTDLVANVNVVVGQVN